MQQNDPLMTVEDLTVKYQAFVAVSKVSFSIYDGDFIALVGANGSGKTTLIKTLMGLLPYAKGSITTKRRLNIGYLPQNTNIQDRFFPATVEEVVGMGLLSKKSFPRIMTRDDMANVRRTLQLLNISHLGKKRIGSLSGGQQQRVLLARAMVARPDILILDEPTSALDQSMRSKFFDLLKDLNQEEGITIVFITHDVASSGNYVNRVLYLDQKLLFDGSFDEFCRQQELSPFIHTHPIHDEEEEDDHDLV